MTGINLKFFTGAMDNLEYINNNYGDQNLQVPGILTESEL